MSISVAAPAPAQAPRTTDVEVEIVGLREARGLVRLCLTRDSKLFPDCKGPASVHATLNAATGSLHYRFTAVTPAAYAIVAFHDANGDGKLNTLFNIPTEGFAFSRNPKMHARAPRFHEVSFEADGRPIAPIKMKYLF